MLATTLFVIMIAMLLTTTLVAMNRQSLLFTAGANDRMAALEMAQSGLNRVVDRWGTDASFQDKLAYEDKEHRRGYTVEFSTNPDEDKSVNNLMNESPVGNVPANSARVIVTGYSGSVTKRVRCLVSRSLFPVGKPVSAAEQAVTIQGELTMNGIKNPKDEVGVDRVKSGLHTNRAGTTGAPGMVSKDGLAKVNIEATSYLSAVTPQVKDAAFSTDLVDQLKTQADALKPDADRVQLARLDIPAALDKAEREAEHIDPPPPPPPGTMPPPFPVKGNVILGREGETVYMRRPIELLAGSTLFVRGGLAAPVIRGKGNVVVGGNVDITYGARTVFSNAAVSLVAGGDINLTGKGPNLGVLSSDSEAKSLAYKLQQAVAGGSLENVQAAGAYAAELSARVTALGGDPTLVDSLDEIHATLALFQAVAALPAGSDLDQITDPRVRFLMDTVEENSESYLRFVNDNSLTNLSSSEFGRGHFQGLAFARGNVKVNGKMQIVGGVEAGREMFLGDTDGSQVELTYCEAYRNLCPAGLGSPFLVSYQEE